MNTALFSLLSKYTLSSSDDYSKALREIVQHLTLLGLWRSKFFEHAAFYGGTALRIFYGLPRFSEDLDFSLLTPNEQISLYEYLKFVELELQAFGFNVSVDKKPKRSENGIESAFVKADTLQNLLTIEAPPSITKQLHRNEILKVKIEVDTNPPPYAETEVRTLFSPIPFQVRIYQQSSLFAGKLHAVLCRNWKTRVKGREFYDFIWFIGMNTPCNLEHLKARMIQTGHINETDTLDNTALANRLKTRFHEIDFVKATDDVLPFVIDRESIQLWSESFFCDAADTLRKN
jgi:predicted nucleotidyltransferase component of viral defense system